MLHPAPKLTVLMPVYNTGKYIGEAIRSVLAQHFTDFELLIINDGSTDDTEAIIRSFSDPRIRLINQPNQGIAAALNLGLLNAGSDLIARFDADDICLPGRLQIQYDFISAHPDYNIVGADAAYVDMKGEFVFGYRMPAHTYEEIMALPARQCPFIHSAVLFRKAAVLEAGGYNPHALAFEDHLLWSALLKKGKGANLNNVLIEVRLNPESISIDEKWRTRRFREIKTAALQRGNITAAEGNELRQIIRRQNNGRIKEGAYYSLLGKKYLWDNHQPKKARAHLGKAIRIHPGRLDSYGILLLSFFSAGFIHWLYQQIKNQA
ncbi:MAG: glycosyltransferase [Ferruginibacter sp.]